MCIGFSTAQFRRKKLFRYPAEAISTLVGILNNYQLACKHAEQVAPAILLIAKSIGNDVLAPFLEYIVPAFCQIISTSLSILSKNMASQSSQHVSSSSNIATRMENQQAITALSIMLNYLAELLQFSGYRAKHFSNKICKLIANHLDLYLESNLHTNSH